MKMSSTGIWTWRIIFLVVFLGWLFIWFMLPTETYKKKWTPTLQATLNSTYFREQGTNLLLFTFPIMLIATLGCVYLHYNEKSRISISVRAKNSFWSSSWIKRPILVMAPLGIVNVVELAFSVMFIFLMIWSLANYLYVSFGHLHMDKPSVQVYVTKWQLKFRSVSLRLSYVGHLTWAFLFFPVTRGSSILPLLGLTSESSIKYHIWLGHISMVLFAAHSIGFFIYWGMTHQMFKMLQWSSTYVSNVAGVIAFLFSLVMWITSLYGVRRKMFEVFFYSHHLYILYVFFYVLHVGVGYLCMILPGIFLFLIDRYLRFLQSRQRSRLISARLLPCGTTELTFSKDPGLKYNPRSVLFLNVASISKLQWHPFTVTSNCELEPDKLSVAIVSEGSWSQKLYKQLSSPSLENLQISTEGPYGPSSCHLLRHESLVMISGGSGITPFVSIIREIIFRMTTVKNYRAPNLLLIAAFKNSTDLAKLDLLLPPSGTTFDISSLQLQIEAYITREKEAPIRDVHNKLQIQTKWFKPDASDTLISSVLGENSWLWLGAIISSSFIMFLLLLGILTRFWIYPIENSGKIFHYSLKILWDMFIVCASVFVGASIVFLSQKRSGKAGQKQIMNMEIPITPMASPASWLCGSGGGEREVESLPSQCLVQSTKLHYGSRPDLKRILCECGGSGDIGVLVSGPWKMRHQVGSICSSASGSGRNLHLESLSFDW
ncbi:hypothetical protein M9H77_16317 [Catharanthus roseus]|uniref:Uncharacterized protein n=1 Tax=Catharanthus roseus TaxID=4058 RepID=A0ACC0B1G4_CATRO|nr:hypothetical protein M9H77_16317 [Catharanthus roseus]